MSAPSTSPRRGWLLLGGIGVCALGIVGATRSLNADAEVLFVNALETKVTVIAGQERFTLAADAHTKRRLPIGELDVDIQGEKGSLTHETVFVTDEGGLFVYNVLGVAPLYSSSVTYTLNKTNTQEVAPRALAGTTFQHLGRIDYVLTSPPERLSMRKEEGRSTTRIHLGQAKGGWKTSFGWLMSLHRTADATRLVDGLWKALPETPDAENAVVTARMVLAREEGLLASLAMARAQRDAHPDDVDSNRLWVYDMRRAGRQDEVRAWYQAALDREPGSVSNAVFLSRVEPEPGATERLEKLVSDHPGDPLPLRTLATLHQRRQRWAEALPLLEAMEQSDPEYRDYQGGHADTLVALGRRKEAVRKLSEHLLQDAEQEELELTNVRLYAKLVGHAAQDGTANAVMRQLVEAAQKNEPEGLVGEWLAASLGQRVDATKLQAAPQGHPLAIATRVLMALAEEPEFAARAVAPVDLLSFRHIGVEAGLLLAAEFERQGDPALAVKMLDASRANVAYGELQDVLSGKLPVESLTLDWEERAALRLVLARQLDARGQDSRAAYARAKKEALLPGPVTIALEHWTRPKPSGAVAGDSVP
ncbi:MULTISPECIES: tetratricopeptide repeat protein [unclassified Corallococcus]|uniref:tetratricopeptide repeat protein n=1 Tax=unclassified Corallococcus TaxID=2685029 RepID=UPI001A8E6F02|nr:MULTISPECIES: hypothetical protein [unclassified Corallococcus]MBN9683214.1 hypothetical protein [Corallococcus sp. NCSPR001]WAS85260.1 hypothetical protein O0N60_39175 [Corallococcus sp. NCRR]